MLEALIAPRIRRTLFEHILTHPRDRFYLRGLAKDLGLPVSPLRRELKRLEHAGMLTTAPEGNILFYAVNTSSPAFLQLQRVGIPSQQALADPPAAQPVLSARAGVPAARSLGEGGLAHGEPIAVAVQPAATAAVRVTGQSSGSSWWSIRLQSLLFGAVGAGMLVIVVIVGLLYIAVANRRLAARLSQVLTPPKPELTVVVPPASSSGTMRGNRWQVVPGAFGGFSSGASNESY